MPAVLNGETKDYLAARATVQLMANRGSLYRLRRNWEGFWIWHVVTRSPAYHCGRSGELIEPLTSNTESLHP